MLRSQHDMLTYLYTSPIEKRFEYQAASESCAFVLQSSMTMIQQSVQLDPLNSPYPIPWNWILATQADGFEKKQHKSRYFRSQSLISPNGQFAAYSRIRMQVAPDLIHSHVSSILFIENLETGDLKTVEATSPFSDNPFSSRDLEREGKIAVLLPISWTEASDRILARECEALFSTDIVSDFAVIWDSRSNQSHTLAPQGVQYSNAVLLGWSQQYPGQVLFRAGTMGDEHWQQWTVDMAGMTVVADADSPMIFGKMVNNIWAGPQSSL